MHLNMSSVKWRPFCLGLLSVYLYVNIYIYVLTIMLTMLLPYSESTKTQLGETIGISANKKKIKIK